MEKEIDKKISKQLKQAQGMLTKVIKMTDEDKYCIDILQQSLATIGLLKSANKILLEKHLNACFKKGMQAKNQKNQEKLIEEVMHVINKV